MHTDMGSLPCMLHGAWDMRPHRPDRYITRFDWFEIIVWLDDEETKAMANSKSAYILRGVWVRHPTEVFHMATVHATWLHSTSCHDVTHNSLSI